MRVVFCIFLAELLLIVECLDFYWSCWLYTQTCAAVVFFVL